MSTFIGLYRVKWLPYDITAHDTGARGVGHLLDLSAYSCTAAGVDS